MFSALGLDQTIHRVKCIFISRLNSFIAGKYGLLSSVQGLGNISRVVGVLEVLKCIRGRRLLGLQPCQAECFWVVTVLSLCTITKHNRNTLPFGIVINTCYKIGPDGLPIHGAFTLYIRSHSLEEAGLIICQLCSRLFGR